MDNKRRNVRGRNRTRRRRFPQRNNLDPVVPRMMVTNRVHTWLTFVDDQHINAAGSSAAGKAYVPTAAWDVDPDIGSTATSGFAEWATLFKFYRVHEFKYNVTVTNREAFPLLLTHGVSNSTLTDSTNLIPISGSKHFFQHSIGAALSGTPIGTLRKRFSVEEVVGSRTWKTDDNYASLTNAIPANNVFLAVQIFSPTAVLVNGAQAHFRISMLVEFYENQNLFL